MKQKIKKNVTLNDLAKQMAQGFNKTNENHEQLARMVSNGFEIIDKKFENVDKNFETVNQRFDKVESNLVTLEDGQEQIKLRLDNVAYRFELVEVQRRVTHLEKKAGVKRP